MILQLKKMCAISLCMCSCNKDVSETIFGRGDGRESQNAEFRKRKADKNKAAS
jgi:hypothetical protein